MKLSNSFKAISKHLTLFTKKDLRTFTNACKDGKLDKIKELLDSKRLRFIALPTDILPYVWKAEVLDYLLTSPLSDEYHNFDLRKLVKNAGSYGYLEIIDYCFKNKKVDFDYELINERILNTATEYQQFKVIQYLLNKPETVKYLDLKNAYTCLLKTAFFHDQMDTIHHLIMDIGIKKNKEIDDYLNLQMGGPHRANANTIKNLFELQDLAKSTNRNKKRNKL